MTSGRKAEHFVTLFDSNFLPQGLALHLSLTQHAGAFHLWVLCMDDIVRVQLERLALPNVSLISLPEAETPELLEVKPTRGRGEYCWTLTPFTPQMVFDRDPHVERVTYLDADLFFFDDPQILLDEFTESGKDVLITEHAFDPVYDLSASHGRFCVQFVTFRRTEGGRRVMMWWQERCLEWCYGRLEDGRFGDQKYLDQWPELFPEQVHVLCQVQKTLGPWNAHYFEQQLGDALHPVFYHFHALRLIDRHRVVLFRDYRMGKRGRALYADYVSALAAQLDRMEHLQMRIPVFPQRTDWKFWILEARNRLRNQVAYAAV